MLFIRQLGAAADMSCDRDGTDYACYVATQAL